MVVTAGAIPSCIVLAVSQGHSDLPMMAAILLSAFVGSITGFAFSAICGAFLFHLSDDPVRVVEVMIACSIANQISMTWSVRHTIRWRDLSRYLMGGGIGVAIGVWVLLHANRLVYTHGLGAFLVVWGLHMLCRRPLTLARRYRGVDVAAGVLGGITGGAAGFPSAPVLIWCGMQGWDRAHQRAIVQPFILIIQVVSLLAIALVRPHAGIHDGLGPDTLLFIPASLLGTTMGLALYHRMSDTQFARVVNMLLIVSGVSFLV